MADLRHLAGKEDTAMLRRLADLYRSNKDYDQALSVCDDLAAAASGDARTDRIRGAVLESQGKHDQAIACFEKAIELQPHNFQLYLMIEQILNSQGKFVEALAELKKLEANGPSAAVIARFHRGHLFASWGLQDKAAECFSELGNLGQSGNPQVKFEIGRSFVALGRYEEATKLLETIPNFADEYIPAQLLMAQTSSDAENRVKIIGKLMQDQPLNELILLNYMEALGRAKRPEEAVQAFEKFISDRRVKVLPPDAAFLALEVLLDQGQEAKARQLAIRAAGEHMGPRWQFCAVLLSLDTDPAAAGKLLPAVAESNLNASLMLFYTACKSSDATVRDGAGEAGGDLQGRPAQVGGAVLSVPDRRCGAEFQGQVGPAQLGSVLGFGRGVAEELLAYSQQDPAGAAREALLLVRASIANDNQLLPLGKLWAMEILQARPACQWAGAIITAGNPSSDMCRKLLSIMEPKDSAVALAIQAQVLRNDRKFDQAAAKMQLASQADKTPQLLLRQATDLEFAGKPQQAEDLYRKVYDLTGDPDAANNLAYIMLALHPTDPDKVAQAKTLIEKAIEQRPDNPDFRDTYGWVFHLMGQHEQARKELRQAVKGQRQSPEVHYHMGETESACGQMDLARWHFQAAVTMGKAMEAQQTLFTLQSRQTLAMAQRALDLVGPDLEKH